MYVRDGMPMPEREEGAAFFQPIGLDDGPHILGLEKGQLTHGFVQRGCGEDPGDPGDGIAAVYDSTFWRFLSVAGAAMGAYHGYKRNDSIGWAIGWGFLGSLAPIIVIPIALAQGFGKRKR